MNIETTPVATPQVIRRSDYRPPDWLVPEVELSFALGLAETHVAAVLRVRRNADGASHTIRLNGDGLTPRLVQVDGITRNDWRMAGGDLADRPARTTPTKSPSKPRSAPPTTAN